jgi:hypothetical protein
MRAVRYPGARLSRSALIQGSLMSDLSAEFFARLGRRGYEPLLAEAVGSIRFDLGHDGGVDHWFVRMNRGDVQVSREEGAADCVIRASRQLFDRITSGRAYLYTAWVRNELRAEGEVRLGYLFQRLMPGPPGAHDPRAFAHERRRPA